MQDHNVYEYINITNVINQLNIKKTSTRGNYIYAICPFCQNSTEKNGYLKINTINNVYVCNKCEASGSSIDLYASLKYISTKEAFKRLLKETPVLDDIPYVYNNPVKNELYRDIVYQNFLEMHELHDSHYKKLKAMNFTDKYINNKKKEICKRLQEQGLKLDRNSRILAGYRL